ncbi:alcohol dehydrogenase catalytic domain-containing protein [Amycolatopsis jejuensis]|uniref:alcohol dehydrogenase catalytic domain-containing protein n=1 Tax=Amycolatopsis jejuensis TaxID=330084 RepID=UPI00068927BB|nr:alcohol dehydrogenase catalytic domain-containing protein [Amycolatopsis jejuensis]
MTVPEKMRAVVMRDFGGPDVLQVEDTAIPRPAAGEALLRVAAVEVSRTRDVATRTGGHPFSRQVSLPHVLGGHFAGEVVSVGEGVDPALAGKRMAVMNHRTCGRCAACRAGRDHECGDLEILGIHRWGSYAEYTTASAGILHPLPDNLGPAEAAALAATGPVALTQLRAAKAGPGTTLLVTGATGALASLLIALAQQLGATVIGLSRRPDTVRPAPGLTVLDATRPDLTDAILAATDGFLAAIDNICAPAVFERYFPALPHGSSVVVSGAIGTPEMPVLPVPARDLYSRSISILGVRSHTEAAAADFWQLVHDGFRLPAGLVHEYPLEDAARAHQDIEHGATTGHPVLVTHPTGENR